MVLPDVLVARRVDDGLPDHAETVLHLGGGRRRLAMELEREPAHVAHEAVEDLIHEAIVDGVETRVLQHELGVHDEHEDLAERHQEIEVAALRVVRRGLGHERTERGDLLDEERDVRRLVGGEPPAAPVPTSSMWRDLNCFNEMRIPSLTYGPGASVGGGNLRMPIETLITGVDSGGETLRAEAVMIRKASNRESHLEVELREGKNREVRRLFEAIGHEVTRLKRIRLGGLELGSLEPGEWRDLTRAEIRAAFQPRRSLVSMRSGR